ncbi:MAG: phage tail tape measure protein [Campylobacterales bacterium]|nr:phage tail tape measure protein [Campylobacterales bacterium]
MGLADLKVKLTLDAVNKLSSPLRTAIDDMKKLKVTSEDVGKHLAIVGAGMTAIGTGLAMKLDLTDIPKQAADAEHALRAMGNVGDLKPKELDEISLKLDEISVKTNQTKAKLLEGMNVLVASGIDPKKSLEFMTVIGKGATASQAEVTDLSKSLFSVQDNLKVAINELPKALDMMSLAGKEGRFELKDMAKFFPTLTAGAQSLGMKGVGAVTQLTAALQVAMKGAGDADQAANNFRNFLQKMTAKETVGNFKKMGVDLEAEFKKWQKNGQDPIEQMILLIQKLTKGDQFKISELFADMQVGDFIKPMIQNMDEYHRIKNKVAGAKGVIDQDYLNMMGTYNEQWAKLKITMASIAMPMIMPALKLITSGLEKLNTNSTAVKVIMGGIAALVATGLGLAALGGVMMITAKTLAIAKVGFVGVMTAVRGVAFAMNILRIAFLTNPIGLVITAIAVGAYLIITHWDKVKAFFIGFFNAPLKTIKNLGKEFFAAGKNIVNSIWQGMQSLAMKPVETIKSIAQKIRNFLPFSPAKEGALRDIHKIKLIETIAGSIKADPMVNAMRSVTQKTRDAIGGGTLAAGSAGHSESGAVNLTYSPVINMSAGATQGSTKEDFAQLLKNHKDEILRMLADVSRNNGRVGY